MIWKILEEHDCGGVHRVTLEEEPTSYGPVYHVKRHWLSGRPDSLANAFELVFQRKERAEEVYWANTRTLDRRLAAQGLLQVTRLPGFGRFA